jgi:hypothetical protein
MPTDDITISIRNLAKTYRLFSHPGDRIKQAATKKDGKWTSPSARTAR